MISNRIKNNPHLNCSDFHFLANKMDSFFASLLEKVRVEHAQFKFWIKSYGYSLEVMKFIKDIS